MNEPLECPPLRNISNLAPREDFSNLNGSRVEAARKVSAHTIRATHLPTSNGAEDDNAAAKNEMAAAEDEDERLTEEAYACQSAALENEADAGKAVTGENEAQIATARERRPAAYSQRVKRARDANQERIREECGAQVYPRASHKKRQRRD